MDRRASYRSVGMIDNTGDPALSYHIQVMGQIISYVHTVYKPQLPGDAPHEGLPLRARQPLCSGPAAVPGGVQGRVRCRRTGSTAPGTASITLTHASHIYNAVARFRPSAVDTCCDNDKLTLVVQLLSDPIGLDHNLTQPLSAMFPTIPVGRCTSTAGLSPSSTG